MLVPNWVRGKTTPKEAGVTMEHVADHIDHICQLAGNASQVSLGTDLDGGFGTEQGPLDVDTIADVRNLRPILKKRGYSEADLDGIMGANWLRFFRKNLPAK
jgi:membrane dipeptidase